jgi:uncharacterized protein YdhG (YjbR/CyaY superfamily)
MVTMAEAKATKRTSGGFSDAEKAAMKERAKETRARGGKEADAAAMREKIAGFSAADRRIAERLHEIVTEAAPQLNPKLYYGAPGWARNGKVVCFFRGADQDKARYATLGFGETAQLDDGEMWPTAYALTDLTDTDAKKIAALIRKAAG